MMKKASSCASCSSSLGKKKIGGGVAAPALSQRTPRPTKSSAIKCALRVASCACAGQVYGEGMN